MGVTGHWISKRGEDLELRSELLAFRNVTGKHDGKKIAQELLSVFERAGVVHKVLLFSA